MKVVISGASGLIGTALTAALTARGDEVVRLQRRNPAASDTYWDPAQGQLSPAALAGSDALVNLAGATLGRRWSGDYFARARRSRLDSTRLLATTAATLDAPPAVMLTVSGAGYYGETGNRETDEAGPRGQGLVADLAADAEAAAEPIVQAGSRLVLARLGPVMSPRGGALGAMLTPFRFGFGGRLGSGRQYMSWISLPDTVRAILHALDTPALSGPVNVVAPQPVTNAEFTRALGRALRRPTFFAVPGWLLRLVLGQMADEMLLISQRVVPRRLPETGFVHLHPNIDAALAAVLAPAPRV